MKCFSKFLSANLAPKLAPKLYQNGPTNLENRGWEDQKSSKFRSCVLLLLLGGLGGVLGASWERFGTVLSGSWLPIWFPKWSQDAQKIDPKIDHFFDVSWNRFLDGFWWNFVPKRSQVGTKMGSKIDDNFEERFLINSCSPCSAGWKNQDLGVEVGSKNQSKIDPKMMSKMKCILASIFDRF